MCIFMLTLQFQLGEIKHKDYLKQIYHLHVIQYYFSVETTYTSLLPSYHLLKTFISHVGLWNNLK